jgi:putative endonuclease
MNLKHYWVYMLYCANNTYYTGYTNDLHKRYQSHVNGTGRCKYTRSFKPLRMAQCWKVGNKALAMKIERYLKALSRIEKEKMVKEPFALFAVYQVKPLSKQARLKAEKLIKH